MSHPNPTKIHYVLENLPDDEESRADQFLDSDGTLHRVLEVISDNLDTDQSTERISGSSTAIRNTRKKLGEVLAIRINIPEREHGLWVEYVKDKKYEFYNEKVG